MKVFFLLVLSHLLTDFVFQGKGLAQRKKESSLALVWHSLVFLACASILLSLLPLKIISGGLFVLLLILTVAHFLFDFLKNYLEVISPRRSFEWLILDQVLHLGFISLSWTYFNSLTLQSFVRLLKAESLSDKLILITMGYVIIWGGTHFVRRLLEKIPPIKEEPSEYNVGMIIGNLERILIFTLVLVDQYAAVGLVLAAKSIARFEDLKKRDFAEYYLIGTLSSTLIAILVGIIVRLLIS